MEVYLARIKKNNRHNFLLPKRPYDGGRDLLNHLPLPIILMRDFNAHNTLLGSNKSKHKWEDARINIININR